MKLARTTTIRNRRQRQTGLGLVEILIAMVLTAIMFNGLMEISLSSRQTFSATDNLTRLQENGRTTVDILVAGLRRSGYLGGNSDITTIAGSAGHSSAIAGRCVRDKETHTMTADKVLNDIYALFDWMLNKIAVNDIDVTFLAGFGG